MKFMKNRGVKITCKTCNAKFYNFNKTKLSCPKCKQNQVYDDFLNKKSKTKKLNIDIFFFDNQIDLKVETLQLKIFAISPEVKLENGWHAIICEDIKENKIEKSDPIIYLNSSPLSGLQVLLSGYRFPGVGSEISKKIVHNPNFSFSLLKENSSTIEGKLGISKLIASALSTGWKIQTNQIVSEIFLRELGFTGLQIKFIEENIGNNVLSIIYNKPSDLLGRIPRITFDQLKFIYQRLDLKPSEKEFAIAATQFWLSKTEERRGHTCAPARKVFEEAAKISKINPDTIAGHLESESSNFQKNTRYNREVISSNISFKRDQSIIDEINRLKQSFANPTKVKNFKKSELKMPKGINLSDEQLRAINQSLSNATSIITGGPGSGKSTLIVGLVKALKLNAKKTIICAPTGRAAKRLSEYKELNSLDPSTIHMHLALAKNKKNQNFDTIIIDEASMIDVNLFLELLINIPSGSNAIFVGDADQLPPIGPGQPFKDIIESEVLSIFRLTGNYRQENLSDIIKGSKSIIEGKFPKLEYKFEDSDFIFLECPREKQNELVMDLYFNKMSSILGESKDNIQILSPMHKGEVGIKILNSNIQNIFSRKGKLVFTRKDGSVQFFSGDKVIQTSNNYDLMVMNGDIGTVQKKIDNKIIVSFDNREITYSGLDPYELDLAYAISIHKSQGSEYPGIIIPINFEHTHMLSRNLLYTGITRGKKLVVLVGEEKIFRAAINAFWKDSRYTNLTSALKNKSELILENT